MENLPSSPALLAWVQCEIGDDIEINTAMAAPSKKGLSRTMTGDCELLEIKLKRVRIDGQTWFDLEIFADGQARRISRQLKAELAARTIQIETRRALGLDPVDAAAQLGGYILDICEEIRQRAPRFAHPLLAVSVEKMLSELETGA